MDIDEGRIYGGCDKETDAGRCNKPVKLAGKKGFIRCPDHPVKRLWPEDELPHFGGQGHHRYEFDGERRSCVYCGKEEGI